MTGFKYTGDAILHFQIIDYQIDLKTKTLYLQNDSYYVIRRLHKPNSKNHASWTALSSTSRWIL